MLRSVRETLKGVFVRRRKPTVIHLYRMDSEVKHCLMVVIPTRYTRLLSKNDLERVVAKIDDGLTMFNLVTSDYFGRRMYIQTQHAEEAILTYEETIIFSHDMNADIPANVASDWLDTYIINPTLELLTQLIEPAAAEKFARHRRPARPATNAELDALGAHDAAGTHDDVREFLRSAA